MSQYLLSVYYVDGEEPLSDDVVEQMYADVDKLNNKMKEQGVMLFGGGLHTPDMATVVRSETGNIVMTDGPFPEAKEQIGGFWIIEAPDLDAGDPPELLACVVGPARRDDDARARVHQRARGLDAHARVAAGDHGELPAQVDPVRDLRGRALRAETGPDLVLWSGHPSTVGLRARSKSRG